MDYLCSVNHYTIIHCGRSLARIFMKEMVNNCMISSLFQNSFSFSLDPESITLQSNDIELAESLHNLSYGRLSSHLQLEETRKYLAPNGRLCINSVPLKIERNNTEYIIGHDDSIVTYYDVTAENGKYRGLMSRGILYKTAENASFQNVYILDIVGSDMSSIRKHLVKHVLRIKQNTQGKTKLFICCLEEFDWTSLLTAINDSGMDKWCQDQNRQRSPVVLGIVEVYNAFKSKY